MKIIAHRGNLIGPDNKRENTIASINECISLGYDVEIDVWHDQKSNKLYLGHDHPQQYLSWADVTAAKNHLWIHCKNLDALDAFVRGKDGFNYFWHDSDDFTLTSKNYIWTYPGKPTTSRSVLVMSQWNKKMNPVGRELERRCYGICTDYPVLLQKAIDKRAAESDASKPRR